MHRFLLRYDELAESAQELASKPFKTTIDVDVDDLPKESQARLKILQR